MSLQLEKYLKQFKIEIFLGFADNYIIYSLSKGKEKHSTFPYKPWGFQEVEASKFQDNQHANTDTLFIF